MNNRTLIISALALVASGCVADSPLFVTGFFPIDPKGEGACELSPGDVSQYNGSLDLSGSPFYQLITQLRSELDSTLDTKSDTTILVTGKHRNTVILDTISFTYTSVPTATVPTVTYEPETVPITVVIEPGELKNVRMGMLGTKALEAIGKVVTSSAETSIIRVKFEFQGQIISGGRIKSTPITFPITVFRSGTTCPMGFCGTGACGNVGGQDGSPIVCASAMGCPTK